MSLSLDRTIDRDVDTSTAPSALAPAPPRLEPGLEEAVQTQLAGRALPGLTRDVRDAIRRAHHDFRVYLAPTIDHPTLRAWLLHACQRPPSERTLNERIDFLLEVGAELPRAVLTLETCRAAMRFFTHFPQGPALLSWLEAGPARMLRRRSSILWDMSQMPLVAQERNPSDAEKDEVAQKLAHLRPLAEPPPNRRRSAAHLTPDQLRVVRALNPLPPLAPAVVAAQDNDNARVAEAGD